MNNLKTDGLKLWCKLALAIFLPPMLILLLGNYFLIGLKRESRFKDFEIRAQEHLEKMALASRTQRYISEEINRIFSKTRNLKDLKLKIEKFLAVRALKADFLIWRRNGKVFHSTFKLKSKPGNWKKAYLDLMDFEKKKYGSEAKIPTAVYENLRRIFGPHFFPRYFYRCYRGNEPRLLVNDCSMNAPLLWLRVARKFGLAVFFTYDVLQQYPGIDEMLSQSDDSGLYLGVVRNNKAISSNEELKALLESASQKQKFGYKTFLTLGNFLLASHFIDDNLIGICAARRDDLLRDLVTREQWLIFALVFAIVLLLLVKSYMVLVKKQKFSLMLRNQLLILFLLSNLLPGYVITIVAYDYLQQYHESLLNQAYAKGLSYLHDVDELYENELTFQKGRIENALGEFVAKLKSSGIKGKSIREFMKQQTPDPYRMFLVGSSTAEVATNEAIVKKGKLIDLIDDDYLRGPHKKQQIDALEKIGKYFLALLNHKPIPSKMGTEVEMLSDALSQQEPVEMMQEFLQRDGGFWNWGIGSKRHPAYIRIFKLFSQDAYDYLFIYLWSSYDLQLNFMSRSFARFSRNESNIKVMAVNDTGNRTLPAGILKNKKLRSFTERLQEKSSRQIDYCTWKGNRYLLVGLKCNKLSHFRLLGLLPLERIERLVAEKKNLLFGLGIVSLLIAVSLGMFVASSIIEPLRELQKGIVALDQRKFSYRLPELGQDEFGHLAEIFNHTLVDLEEMHTASSFKDKIFAGENRLWQTDRFEIFAHTMSFSENSSDYLEVFAEKHDRPARIIVGDVAESGVAAILILAFVKSALMQLEEFYDRPADLTRELERLLEISSRRGHGRKMAFEYALLHDEVGEVELVNAGMFLPVLLDCENASLNQIEQSFPALGDEASQTRNARKLALGENQALIIFSNGVLAEGKISEEEVLTIFSKIDLHSCESIFNGFFEQFKSKFEALLEDDITMIVVKPHAKRNNHGKTNV